MHAWVSWARLGSVLLPERRASSRISRWVPGMRSSHRSAGNEASRASALKAVACLLWADIPLAKTSHAGKSQVRGRRRRLPAPRARSGGAEWTTAELVRGFGRRVRWGKSPFGSLWAFVSLLTQRRGRRRPAVPSEAALESPALESPTNTDGVGPLQGPLNGAPEGSGSRAGEVLTPSR